MATAPALSPTETVERLRRQRAAIARRAPGAFVEFVMKDSAGRPFKMAPMHRAFHSLAQAHKRLVLMAHFESGKSEQISIGRTLFELGQDPSLTFAIVAKSSDQARKIVRRLKELIEGSPELRQVFPDLVPGTPWGDTAFNVARAHGQKDLSVQAFGIDTSILGARIDRLILDDISDWEVARTEVQRRATTDKVLNHMLTRVTERGRVICAGVPFHVEDTISTLARMPGWHLARFPVEQSDGTPNWLEHWSKDRIAEARATLGPAAAARQLDLNAVSDADASFIAADIDFAIRRGDEHSTMTGVHATPLSVLDGRTYLVNRPSTYKVCLGVDPAVSLKPSSDLSAITCIMVHPSGDREILACDSGRWPLGTIVEHIDRMVLRFNADVVAVETVAAQDWLAQAVLSSPRSIKVLRHQTGRGQMSLAWRIEELGRELRNGRWIIPSAGGRVKDPEVAALVRDMSLMSRSDAHVPDRVASLLIADWAASQSEATAEVGFVDLLSR